MKCRMSAKKERVIEELIGMPVWAVYARKNHWREVLGPWGCFWFHMATHEIHWWNEQ